MESFHVTSFKPPFPTCLVLRASGIRGHSLTSEPFPPAQVALVVKNPPANAGYGRCGFNPWVGKIPWGWKWQPTPVYLPGKYHEQRSLATVHGVAKSWT